MINCMFLGLSTCKNDIVKVKCWLILSPWPVMSKSEAPSVYVVCWQKGLIVYGERECLSDVDRCRLYLIPICEVPKVDIDSEGVKVYVCC